MKIRPLAVAVLALALPFAAVACGGSDDNNSGERPSAEDLAKAFQDQVPDGVPNAEAIAQCIGEGLEASDLPNGVLRSMAAGEETAEIDADNEEEYTKIVTDVSTDCATEAIGDVTGTTGG